jgi:hypothetical protein
MIHKDGQIRLPISLDLHMIKQTRLLEISGVFVPIDAEQIPAPI